MKNAPNKLISDICDAISSGKNFGGWTDALLTDATLGPAEYRTSSENKRKKFKLMRQQQREIDNFIMQSGRKRLAAQGKDNKKRTNTLRNI